MSKKYFLYNPHAGNGKCKAEVEEICARYDSAECRDVTEIKNMGKFFGGLDINDTVIICGGDGTLNHFVNDIKDVELKNDIYYYAVGSGNDFGRDLGKDRASSPDYKINDYVVNLPTVTVNGETRVFINGVGYGIDGYCCEVGDALRAKNEAENTDEPINYTAIAIKGLLFKYKPTNATVTVDGVKHTYKKVWIAPTMNGRYYGGGMMPAPNQQRLGADKKLTVMVFHGTSKLKTLMIFPSLFKGEHVKHTEAVELLTGKEITVEFDRPAPLQIDGETVLGVTSYTANINKQLTEHFAHKDVVGEISGF